MQMHSLQSQRAYHHGVNPNMANRMNKCPKCNGPLADLFTGQYCKNECDRVKSHDAWWEGPEFQVFEWSKVRILGYLNIYAHYDRGPVVTVGFKVIDTRRWFLDRLLRPDARGFDIIYHKFLMTENGWQHESEVK